MARLSAQEATLSAARHVAVPGADERARKDQFDQQVDLPTIDISGYSPGSSQRSPRSPGSRPSSTAAPLSSRSRPA